MGKVPSMHIVRWAGFTALAAVVLSAACWDEPQSPGHDGDDAWFAPQFTGAAWDAMESPVRLATTPTGELLVSDSRSYAILTVNPATLLPEQMLEVNGRPLGVAYMSGRMYVGNGSTGTVDIYDGRGRKRGSLGHAGKPTDLATDDLRNWIFVLNAKQSVVEIFDKQGRVVDVLLGPGTAPDQLLVPMGIAVDPAREEVYVTDYGDMDKGYAAIKIFNYQGEYLESISGRGNCGMLGCSGGFSRPQGIAVDGQGQVYVVDLLLAQVLVFDRATLKLVRTLGGRNGGFNSLRMPLDVVLGSNGDVYVTSNGTGTVAAFRGGAVTP